MSILNPYFDTEKSNEENIIYTNTENAAFSMNKKKMFELIDFDAVSIEELLEKSKLNPNDLMNILLELELEGYIKQDAKGYYNRKKNIKVI